MSKRYKITKPETAIFRGDRYPRNSDVLHKAHELKSATHHPIPAILDRAAAIGIAILAQHPEYLVVDFPMEKILGSSPS